MRSVVLATIAGVCSHVLADHVVYRFSGVVTEASGSSPVPVGTPYTFEYRFDTTMPDSHPLPSVGLYVDAIVESHADLGGVFQTPAAAGSISVLNDLGGDKYTAQAAGDIATVEVFLTDPQGLALSDDHLPTVITLDAFVQRTFRITVDNGPVFWQADGSIDSLLISFIDCYVDCNTDGVLNLADFGCFQTRFALGEAYADCNGDGVRNLADFGCFTTKFALACP